MDKEVEYGNVEYKRQLSLNISYRVTGLIGQMQWRLDEGNGKAIYMLGLNDDGTVYKFKDEEESETLSSIRTLAIFTNASVHNIIKHNLLNHQYFYEVIIYANNKLLDDKRILIMGNEGSGKTSYLSFLTYELNDNGKGYIRNKILRHDQECIKGTTMSLTLKKIGYNDHEVFTYKNNISAYEIKNKSSYIITYFDSPLTQYELIIPYMHHVLILYNQDNIVKFVKLAQKYNIPHTIVNKNIAPTLEFYKSIDLRSYHNCGIFLLTIITTINENYVVSFVNINNTVNLGDKYYTFNHINNPIALIEIKELRYCDKYLRKIDKNITFTALISCDQNLKKYKRNLFYPV